MNNKEQIDWEAINYAIALYLNLGFKYQPKDKKSMLDEFGKEISDKVDEIYDYSTGFNVDWRTDTMESIKLKLEESLKQNYGGWNEQSINILKRCFSYTWR